MHALARYFNGIEFVGFGIYMEYSNHLKLAVNNFELTDKILHHIEHTTLHQNTQLTPFLSLTQVIHNAELNSTQ
jgi:putative IMPACT (imprinted ancient) family translation regulator